jgi:hypothetical protein
MGQIGAVIGGYGGFGATVPPVDLRVEHPDVLAWDREGQASGGYGDSEHEREWAGRSAFLLAPEASAELPVLGFRRDAHQIAKYLSSTG